jgi:L-lysine exporter family protein LysE/ArgO
MAASAFVTGFGLGFSLILAIGAQNAFVLRQGLRRRHVLAVVLTCAVSATGVSCFNMSKNVTPLGIGVTGRVSNYALRAVTLTFGLSAVRYIMSCPLVLVGGTFSPSLSYY